MVPGLTLRESQYTETRRQELLARVAAEQRMRQFAEPNPRWHRLAGFIHRATALFTPLRHAGGLPTKPTAATVRVLTTPK